MSSQTPPDPNVNLYNPLYWTTADQFITEDYANKHYLKFPVAQGTENLQDINVNGVSTFNSPATMTSANNTTMLTIQKTSGYSNGGLIMKNTGIDQKIGRAHV